MFERLVPPKKVQLGIPSIDVGSQAHGKDKKGWLKRFGQAMLVQKTYLNVQKYSSNLENIGQAILL